LKKKYYLIYKPFGMLSQFSREIATHVTLADLPFDFPSDVYPVGRLDKDSEGLLLLTNDTSLNQKLLDPKFKHERTYWVQVEGQLSRKDLAPLKKGVRIKINKKTYRSLPAKTHLLDPPPLPSRDPPIRFRKNVPDSWASITLIEGKNRQVRRMFAKIGFPVLRLVRTRIVNLHLDDARPGEVREIEREEINI
jgi:23S rRNA pseudouridine2457 synthase